MLWCLLGVIALLYILLQLPVVQQYLGDKTSDALSKKLGTEVSVGHVDLGLLNRVIIDDVHIKDQSGGEMLTATRLSAKVDVLPLLKGNISIPSAQIFGMKACLYKDSANAQPNYQFVLDSLASKDNKEKTPLHLNINSLIIRNGAVKYDQKDQPVLAGRFSPYHIDVSNLSGHLMLYELSDNAIHARIKKLSLNERSGIRLNKLSGNMSVTSKGSDVTGLQLDMPHTHLSIDSLHANLRYKNGQIDTSALSYQLVMNESELTPSDFAPFHPALSDFNDPLFLNVQLSGNKQQLTAPVISVYTPNNALNLSAHGNYSKNGTSSQWYAHVDRLSVKAEELQKIAKNFSGDFTLPSPLLRLGNIAYYGEIGQKDRQTALSGQLSTDLGDIGLLASITGQDFTGHVETAGLDIGRLLQNDHLGQLGTSIQLEGRLPLSKLMSVNAKGHIFRLDYDQHTYNNITVDGIYDHLSFNGRIGMDDPNGNIDIDGMIDLSSAVPTADISASARNFNPEAFGLTTNKRGQILDFDVTANLQGTGLKNLQGQLDVSHLTHTTLTDTYTLDNLHIDTGSDAEGKYVMIDSDFGHTEVSGDFKYETLLNSVINIVSSKIPIQPLLARTTNNQHNEVEFKVDITKDDWLRHFTDLDLTFTQPLHLEGYLDEGDHAIQMSCHLPAFTYKGNDYQNANVQLETVNDTLKGNANISKIQNDGRPLNLTLHSKAIDQHVESEILFDNNKGRHALKGALLANADFFADELHGQTTHIQFLPSDIHLYDTSWEVQPSELFLSKKRVEIDNFSVGNGEQQLTLTGAITENPSDSIHAELRNIDLSFLSGILNVRGVDFGGNINGKASVSSVYDSPEAQARLLIDDFRFVDGRIGEMDLKAAWNSKDNQILLNGLADDQGHLTKVDGHIGLSPGEIELNIGANGTPLQFIERFCGSFMKDVEARATGQLRLFGPLSNINLEGKVVADGDLSVSSLNTTYTLQHDTIRMEPDHIYFTADTIVDRHGHRGLVNGEVRHQHLSNFTYDLLIQANNLLSYDFPDFGNDTFCGTVYATGDCHIKGESGEVTIDVDATPNRNTVFYYNAASPDALNDQEFITWNDATPVASDYEGLPSASSTRRVYVSKEPHDDIVDIPSNLHMNFRINATPEATLRLLMDEESGDYIALNGSGTLRATYFNKGSFHLFGNYLVDHGVYKLTIQNVVKKDFQFQEGGSIRFGGNPYDAALDLKALYTVNGVSLADLNLGSGFNTNNIRVNCIMNITGTPDHPSVDFDMELPTVNSDAQQMIRSLINSEEELNQQVIYLLAIGRFYNQNYLAQEGQSQTSLAMQSLLSGTISQQINNLLSSFVKTSNWNFGANISTGDEGWNNAEYEGLLSGRLLDNRLLINGQFGYRDNPNATTSFIGDFDIRYMLNPNGNLAVKVYNQTNDRYFIKNSLNTQGVGLIMKKDFNGWRELFGLQRKRDNKTRKTQ